jgi:hypothetical protein
MKIRIAALVLALAAMVSAPAAAATVNPIIGLQVDRSNGLQVYALDNGNFLGLWRFNNREGINPGAGAVTISTADDILGGFFRGRDSIVGFYNGAIPLNDGAAEFTPLVFGFVVSDNALLPQSLWIEWTGGAIRYRQPNGRAAGMNSRRVTLEGDPLAVVPTPAALPLLLAGLGALGLAARRRKAA